MELLLNELIVHPDIIKNLGIGQCIWLSQHPSKIDLLNIRLTSKPKLIKPVTTINPATSRINKNLSLDLRH